MMKKLFHRSIPAIACAALVVAGCSGAIRHVVEIDRARTVIDDVKKTTPTGDAGNKLEDAEEMLEQAVSLEKGGEYDKAKDSAEFSIKLAESAKSMQTKSDTPPSDTKNTAVPSAPASAVPAPETK